jgi:hypothetical protein
MSTLSLRLPDSLHKRLKEVARREGISINQFISTAAAEKLSALMTVEYLQERAGRGDRARFDAVLAKIADAPADAADRFEEPRRRRRRS